MRNITPKDELIYTFVIAVLWTALVVARFFRDGASSRTIMSAVLAAVVFARCVILWKKYKDSKNDDEMK